jgi:putative phage-type endonuclease
MTVAAQRTEGWFADRLGKVTASRTPDVMARTKNGFGASRANYMAELMCERLTGSKTQSYTNAAMQWGTDKEPEALEAYMRWSGQPVDLLGFEPHPAIVMSGASPDGVIVAKNCLVEIKCPNTATHIETLLTGAVPEKYVLQMQWQMACTDCSACHYVSYDPRLPETMRLFVKATPRDAAVIGKLTAGVVEFLAELDAKLNALIDAYGAPAERNAA